MRTRVIALSSAAALAVGLLSTGSPAAATTALGRPADPVVLTGADLPKLVNGPRGNIVGFRWSGTAWVQLPIQIDERALVNFGKVYNNPSASFYDSSPALVTDLVYTGANTFTGNDPDPKFDSNDELAFMARDAGVLAPSGTNPAGTTASTGVRVKITDPLDANAEGYVYLYRKAVGSPLKQGAATKYVKYTFKLLSGGYKTTYKTINGPNPENTTFTGATYRHHFSDRWLSDQLVVTAPGATGVDLLDRHKVLFSPTECGRSEDTFDKTTPYGSAEGAFVTNKVGPIRVIRSYVGANSGPSTQRTHVFYDQREDIRTDLRVHPIGSIMDFFDYSPAASGMTYRNDFNQGGLTVDGVPDSPVAGVSSWEQITGAQGTINQVQTQQTSFAPPTVQAYYLDDSTPSDPQCTGDAFAYGASGTYIHSDIPNTDPAHGAFDRLHGERTMYFESPNKTAADAIVRRNQVVFPLTTAVVSAP
ncbi:MAG: hypothetical protein ABJC79_12445 [Acidimicrobiia bacterium]